MIAQKGIDKVVKFVAIKNGMHSSKGYVYFGKNIKKYEPENLIHYQFLSELKKDILDSKLKNKL